MKKKNNIDKDNFPYRGLRKRKYRVQDIIDEYKPIFFRWLKDSGYYLLYMESFYLESKLDNRLEYYFDERIQRYCNLYNFSLKRDIVPYLFEISTNYINIPISDVSYDKYYLCSKEWIENSSSLI